MPTWCEYFSSVADPRRQSGLTKHLLSEILGLALCAMLCGADDFVEMALFGRERLAFLRERLGFVLENGIPSHDTLNRVFKKLNPHTLENCLLAWLNLWQQQQSLRHLCVDGKVARGSWQHSDNVCALTSVSVFASKLRLMLCSGRLPEQGGEHLLALRLLELFDLEGALVTGDAAYCQKDITRLVVEHKGDYLWVLKANHPLLYTQVKNAFDIYQPPEQPIEQGHGRQEARRVRCARVSELGLDTALTGLWPGLQTVVCLERKRQVLRGQKAGQVTWGQVTWGRWYYLSSLAPDEALLAHAIRAHWTIENQAH